MSSLHYNLSDLLSEVTVSSYVFFRNTHTNHAVSKQCIKLKQ